MLARRARQLATVTFFLNFLDVLILLLPHYFFGLDSGGTSPLFR
jgi:hypothetical protein